MQFAIRAPTSNRVASKSGIVDVAQAAEALGFAAVSAHDHLQFNGWWVACGSVEATDNGDDRSMFEVLTTLSYVAAKTQRVKLMTAILLMPVREVVLMAKQVATLDALSEGRVILGVGIGSRPLPGGDESNVAKGRWSGYNEIQSGLHGDNAVKEYRTFKAPRHRGRAGDEYIQAMKVIWTQESATFKGEFVEFEEIDIFPKPVQSGGPPVWIGGTSPFAHKRVVEHGDVWLPDSLTPATYAEGVAHIHELAREAGRPAPTEWAINMFTTVAPTDQEAIDIFTPTMKNRFKPEHLLERNLVGSPLTIARRLTEYQAAGVTFVEMKPIYRNVTELIGMMEMVSREVMPALQDGSGAGEAGLTGVSARA